MITIGYIYDNIFLKWSKYFSRKNLYLYLKEMAKDLPREEYCVNIGAGGQIAEIIMEMGFNVTHIDIDPNRKPDMIMNIENLDKLEDNSVGVFFCMEVLEHVQNPFVAVEEIKRVLKPGGVFIGSTPFIFPIHDAPYDYYRYTRFGVEHLFKDFKLEVLKERNSYIESIYVLVLRILNTGSKKDRVLGILLSPFMLLSHIFTLSFFRLVKISNATTGYCYRFSKK